MHKRTRLLAIDDDGLGCHVVEDPGGDETAQQAPIELHYEAWF